MLKDFKEFINKGNVFDLAIGVMIGGAFGKIVTSLVNDIVMPPIGAINKVDLTNLFISLNGIEYPTLKAAKDAGAPTLNLGLFQFHFGFFDCVNLYLSHDQNIDEVSAR